MLTAINQLKITICFENLNIVCTFYGKRQVINFVGLKKILNIKNRELMALKASNWFNFLFLFIFSFLTWNCDLPPSYTAISNQPRPWIHFLIICIQVSGHSQPKLVAGSGTHFAGLSYFNVRFHPSVLRIIII